MTQTRIEIIEFDNQFILYCFLFKQTKSIQFKVDSFPNESFIEFMQRSYELINTAKIEIEKPFDKALQYKAI